MKQIPLVLANKATIALTDFIETKFILSTGLLSVGTNFSIQVFGINPTY